MRVKAETSYLIRPALALATVLGLAGCAMSSGSSEHAAGPMQLESQDIQEVLPSVGGQEDNIESVYHATKTAQGETTESYFVIEEVGHSDDPDIKIRCDDLGEGQEIQFTTNEFGLDYVIPDDQMTNYISWLIMEQAAMNEKFGDYCEDGNLSAAESSDINDWYLREV